MNDEKSEVPGGEFSDEDNDLIERAVENMKIAEYIKRVMDLTGMTYQEVIEHAKRIVEVQKRKEH